MLIGLLLGSAGGIDPHRQFFLSYLVAYLYWLGSALGCLVFLMLQYVTGGAWGLLMRRILEAAAGTLPLLAVLILPVLYGLPSASEYTQWHPVPTSEELHFKAAWLSAPFVLVRAVIYFTCWVGMGRLFRGWSKQQDEGPDGRILNRCEALSPPGLVVYALTITFASIDWVMSLEPDWYSTIYPVMFAVGQMLNGLAFALAVLLFLADRPPFAGVLRPRHLRDLGSLLLAFVIFWAYMSISQFLLIWVGNLPEEIPWYLRRSRGGWQYVVVMSLPSVISVCLSCCLLQRDVKEQRRRLLAVAVGLLAMRFLDMFWWVEPAFTMRDSIFLAAGRVGLGRRRRTVSLVVPRATQESAVAAVPRTLTWRRPCTMSEHTQPYPVLEYTPGVTHEKGGFDFWLIMRIREYSDSLLTALVVLVPFPKGNRLLLMRTYRKRRRTGPRAVAHLICPSCVTTIAPWATSRWAASRTAGIDSRQSGPVHRAQPRTGRSCCLPRVLRANAKSHSPALEQTPYNL